MMSPSDSAGQRVEGAGVGPEEGAEGGPEGGPEGAAVAGQGAEDEGALLAVGEAEGGAVDDDTKHMLWAGQDSTVIGLRQQISGN